MKTLLPLLLTVTFATITFAIILHGFRKSKRDKKGKKTHQYLKRNPLSENEQVLYWRLINALPEHIILSQVAMSRCIETKTQAAFGTISQKSIDFIVCNKASEIIAAIEIDDKSHSAKARQKADITKNNALAAAGIRLIRWPANPLPNETIIKNELRI